MGKENIRTGRKIEVLKYYVILLKCSNIHIFILDIYHHMKKMAPFTEFNLVLYSNNKAQVVVSPYCFFIRHTGLRGSFSQLPVPPQPGEVSCYLNNC